MRNNRKEGELDLYQRAVGSRKEEYNRRVIGRATPASHPHSLIAVMLYMDGEPYTRVKFSKAVCTMYKGILHANMRFTLNKLVAAVCYQCQYCYRNFTLTLAPPQKRIYAVTM